MLKTFNLNLDIEQQPSNSDFYVNTLDINSVQLTISILESGIKKDITGTSIVLDIMNPDGNTVTQNCTITDAINGVVTVILPTGATSLIGQHQGLLKIMDSDSSVTVTNSFRYEVNQGY